MLLPHLVVAVLLLVMLPTVLGERCLRDLKEVNPKRFLNYRGQTLDIRIEVSQRVTHQLISHIFKIFLEEAMGYPYVRLVEQDSHFNVSQVFERLGGSIDEGADLVPSAMVNLEVWVPPEFKIHEFLKIHHVKDCGIVAPPGRFGWFVPRNLSLLVPEMDHWRIFKNATTAAVFDVSENDMIHIRNHLRNASTKRYYCKEDFCVDGMFVPEWCKPLRHKTQPCALLFADDSDSSGFVHQHILEWGLYVKVAWVGPHLQQLTSSLINKYYSQGLNHSVVILTWSPGKIVIPGNNQYISIAFPPCEAFQSYLSIGCKYEMQRLTKLSWSMLDTYSEPLYQAITKISFTGSQYKALLDTYNQEQYRTLEDVACEWLLRNNRTWTGWIPANDDRNKLFIGGIFPLSGSGSSATAKGIVRAAEMAIQAVNHNDSVLRDYQIKMRVSDGMCKPDQVMNSFFSYIGGDFFKKLVGVLGPACSETVEPLAGVTKHFKTVVISYSAEGASFSDRTKYPYFFRTIGENKQYKYVYLHLLNKLKWRQVASLTEDGQKYTEYISHMEDFLKANKISFVANKKFPREWKENSMSQYLLEMKNKNARIIICDVYDEAARALMCEAYRLKMTAKQGYVWFLPLWLSPDWYNTDKYLGTNTSCTTRQMIQAINGHLALTPAYFAPDNAVMQENYTVGEWKKKYRKILRGERESNYAGYAYDAVWTYAFALDTLMKENQSYLSEIHSETSAKRFVEILESTDFNGVSGRIQFVGPSRMSMIHVMQWLDNSTRIVGTFYPNVSTEKGEVIGGELDLNTSAITWLTADGKQPEDGKEGLYEHCVLRGIAELLDVNCEVAIVIVNIFGFGLLGILLIVAFIVMKRRYDKKVQMNLNYMKSLGIDLLSPSSMTNPDKWEIPRDRVVINRKLGEGAFGTVYGGEADFNEKGWVAVAVKTLKVGSTTEEKLDFLSEAEVMKRFEHKNIVKLLGVCTKNEPVYTVMEFMLYGDLKTFLLARRHLVNEKNAEESDEISSKKLTSMALDIARALSYLAELKYVHRDVACRNCLVNASRVVKLGDFGMTRPMFENDYYKFNRKGMLPVRWMAPESLALGIFTPSSDVWSYGVLLYEIITFGSFPFQGLSNNQVLEHVKAGNTLTIPAGVKVLLESLIRSCWNLESKRRPQASEIVEFLANNPRLISPCLDVPLASVQMEDTGQLDMQLPETFRKCSVSLSFRSGSESGGPRQFAAMLQDSGTGTLLQENGCAREPLLGTPRSSSSSSGMGLTKYVTLQHKATSPTDSQCDDYCTHDPAPAHAISVL